MTEKEVYVFLKNFQFAKSLASNDKKVRDLTLKALKKWMRIHNGNMSFTEDHLFVIWKGLFFTMWMSDKMLVQEECAENISSLIHLPDWNGSLLFFKCGLVTLIYEWPGIDHLRLNKFLMLVRRFLRQTLVVLNNEEWNETILEKYNEVLSETILVDKQNHPLGLAMHFIEIYLEEVAKVSKGKIHKKAITELLKPFMKLLIEAKEPRLVSHIIKYIFNYLMWQSECGIDHAEKFNEWKQRGFPGGRIEAMVKDVITTVSDEEMEEDGLNDADDKRLLDPRAGQIDVELQTMDFDPNGIVQELKTYKSKVENTNIKKQIHQLIENFELLARGRFPLGVKKVPVIEDAGGLTVKKAVKRLVNFEKKLMMNDGNFVVEKRKRPKKKPIKRCESKEKVSVKLKRKKLKQKGQLIKRCSGTWQVYEVEENAISNNNEEEAVLEEDKQKSAVPIRNNAVKLMDNNETEELKEPEKSVALGKTLVTPINESQPKTIVPENKTFPVRKQKKKIVSLHKKNSRSVPIIKNRKNLVRNPFSNSISSTNKKVRIALNLNTSQEISEHLEAVEKSPGIPFNAQKQPGKPVLKKGLLCSPINPFFSQRIY